MSQPYRGRDPPFAAPVERGPGHRRKQSCATWEQGTGPAAVRVAAVVAGVIAMIAAWAAIGRIPNADPNAYQNANLETISGYTIMASDLPPGMDHRPGTNMSISLSGDDAEEHEDDATRIMLHVHNHGVGECGVFTYEVAETKVTQVMDFARENQHPLQCTLEKA